METRYVESLLTIVVCGIGPAVLGKPNPTVVAEWEQQVGALIINFGVQTQAILNVISGGAEPFGLLPLQMPANMETVEQQKERVRLKNFLLGQIPWSI